MISIKQILADYAASLKKVWEHDRSKTVGASDGGQCARKVYFDKNDVPQDPDYVPAIGQRTRGDIMEEHFFVPALRQELAKQGLLLLFAGKEQKTLVRGYLSATTDGLIVNPATKWCINIDCKTFDPRMNLENTEKPEHHFQTQIQMGLIRELTEYQPDESIVAYINASDWLDVREPYVTFDPKIYANAHRRAERIMTERDPLGLPPEGKMAGGDECKHCAWASHCANVTVAGVPKDVNELDEDELSALELLVDTARDAREARDEGDVYYANAIEAVKLFMREHNTRRVAGEGWSVSYSNANGKMTLDTAALTAAAEAAGFDLEPYYRQGNPSERLTLK